MNQYNAIKHKNHKTWENSLRWSYTSKTRNWFRSVFAINVCANYHSSIL